MAAANSVSCCRRFVRLVALAALGCAVCEAAGRALLAGPEAGNTSFPYWKYSCSDPCSCSPYGLQYSPGVVPTGAPGVKTTCFDVKNIGCNASMPCCAALLRSVSQIALPIGEDCLKPSLMRIELNGKNWTSWETKTYKTSNGTGYALRLYNMKFNGTTFPNSKICLVAKDSCDFRKRCADDPKACRFAVSESTSVRTCSLCPVQPAPKPLPKTCDLCEEVSVMWPLDVPFLDCKTIGSMMVDNLTAAVKRANGSIAEPFTYTCPNSTYIKACGKIMASNAVEAAVQEQTYNLLMQTNVWVLWGEFCPKIKKAIDVSVTGTCAVSDSQFFASMECDWFHRSASTSMGSGPEAEEREEPAEGA